MTDMVFGAAPAKPGEPILPQWWRTIDRWSLAAIVGLFLIGTLLGLAASPPLAVRNGLDPFHYVWRQAAFGAFALVLMLVVSMMSPLRLRRWGVIVFGVSVVALALLPVFGTDFGKGAVRWYSLRVVSVQPSEFLKPSLRDLRRLADGGELRHQGAAGEGDVLRGRGGADRGAGAAAGLRAGGAGHRHLGADVLRRRGAGTAARHGRRRRSSGVGWFAYENSEHVARRIDGFLSSGGRSADPDRLCHERHPGGRLPRRRHRQRQREVDAAGRAYRLHHRGGGGGVRADPLRGGDGALPHGGGALAAPAGARARSVHPAGGDRARGAARHAGDDQHRRGGAAAAGQGHDAAADLLWRVVADRRGAGARACCWR